MDVEGRAAKALNTTMIAVIGLALAGLIGWMFVQDLGPASDIYRSLPKAQQIQVFRVLQSGAFLLLIVIMGAQHLGGWIQRRRPPVGPARSTPPSAQDQG